MTSNINIGDNKMNDSFTNQLIENAIFQLSLSSKELFHSNFLAWLAEDEKTRNVFNIIMRNWTDDPNWEYNPEKMIIKREYNHFDFCICDKYEINKKEVVGRVQFVLENKFKSIAYKAQLENYEEKVISLNQESFKNKYKSENKETHQRLPKNWKNRVEHPDTKYVLLTLAEQFVDKKAILDLGWKIITYAEFAKILRNGAKHICNSFHRELIEHYCDFIETFAQHTQALLELKHLLANGVVFCVQQQGDNNLSIGIVVKPGEAIEKALRKNDKSKWNESIKSLISTKHLEHIISGNEFYSFQSEGACGFYYIKSSKKFNIIDTLNYMIELMDKAISATNSLTL